MHGGAAGRGVEGSGQADKPLDTHEPAQPATGAFWPAGDAPNTSELLSNQEVLECSEAELKRQRKELRRQQKKREQEESLVRVTVQQVSGNRLATLKVGPQHLVRDLAQSLGQAAGVDGSGLVLIKDTEVLDGQLTAEQAGLKEGSVLTAVRSPGLFLAAAHIDGSVVLWSAETGKQERHLQTRHGAVLALSFSPSGTLLLVGCTDGTMSSWSVAQGHIEVLFQGHRGAVNCVAFSPDGATAVSGSADMSVRIWRSLNGECLGTVAGHTGPVTSLSFISSGEVLATGSADKTARLWHMAKSKCIAVFEGHHDGLTSVALSHGSEPLLLATGSLDSTVRVWLAKERGKCWRKLKGHKGPVQTVVFVEIQSRFAVQTGSEQLLVGVADGSAMLWDIVNAVTVHHFGSHHGPKLSSLACSPKSSLLAIGSEDGTVQFWTASTGKKNMRLVFEQDGSSTQHGPAIQTPAVSCVSFSAGPMLLGSQRQKLLSDQPELQSFLPPHGESKSGSPLKMHVQSPRAQASLQPQTRAKDVTRARPALLAQQLHEFRHQHEMEAKQRLLGQQQASSPGQPTVFRQPRHGKSEHPTASNSEVLDGSSQYSSGSKTIAATIVASPGISSPLASSQLDYRNYQQQRASLQPAIDPAFGIAATKAASAPGVQGSVAPTSAVPSLASRSEPVLRLRLPQVARAGPTPYRVKSAACLPSAPPLPPLVPG